MFVCPHCQFENPSSNRFCQQCGEALRELQAIVTLVQMDGKALGGATTLTSSSASEPAIAPANADSSAADTDFKVADLLTEEKRLAGQPRYQLRASVDPEQPIQSSTMTLAILDCEPASDSPLIQFLETVPADTEEAELDTMIPREAFPYWKLQEQFFPMVPELHAAWQTPNYSITVIEDRSTWRTLTELLTSNSFEPLELVHWLYEILTLWSALSEFRAEASLLDVNNLRVDDDQVVCLKRLIANPDGQSFSLENLGGFWQTWLAPLKRLDLPSLQGLIDDMATGTLTNTVLIKDGLADIADQIQEKAIAQHESVEANFEMTDTDGFSSDANDDAAAVASSSLETEELPPMLMVEDLLSEGNLEDFDEPDEDDGPDGDNSGLNDLPTMALPMKLARLDEVGRTHVGRQRSHNEDAFFAETLIQRIDSPSGTTLTARGLFILCDGMGGHSGGEVASNLAVTTLRNYFLEQWQSDLPEDDIIQAAILQANQAIYEKNESEAREGSARMGTTLVMVLIADQQVVVAHVGDSRLYCLTRQGLSQTTVDHEVGQREINRGVEPAIAYARPDAYQLTQALGPRSNNEIMPAITRLTISQDTLLILCSDGLSDNDLLETHVESHLEPLMRSRADLEEGLADLIDLANEQNGHDNITAILVRMKLRPNLEAAREMTTP